MKNRLRPLTWLLLFLAPIVCRAEVACKSSCPGGGKFSVNLQDRCMCIPDKNGAGPHCFKIDIGKDGPSMSSSGKGKTHDANGAKYQTTSGPGTTGYDKDAIATGIQSMDGPGKWIHKTRGCSQGGNTATKGCIAVPCDVWPLVKAQKGQEVEICGSEKYSGTSHMYGAPNSAEDSDDDGNSKGSK